MEKTLVEQSLNLPKLFDFKELLDTLKLMPVQVRNMKGIPSLQGLTEKQIRLKGRNSKLVKTDRFGVNSCLYYLLFKDIKGLYLFLFNGDKECFRAYYFSSILPN